MFDLYFAGTTAPGVTAFAKEVGANKLFTQLSERNLINDWVETIRTEGIKNKVFVDSGAYTAHTKGAEIDVDGYIEYINQTHKEIALFAQLDKIPGRFNQTRTAEDIANAPRESWDNYLYMRPKLIDPDKLLPIFHQDENFDWLINMLEWTDDKGKHIPYIGISSSKDKPSEMRKQWYKKVFAVIHASSNPDVKTHCFGTSAMAHLELFPFTSSDATTWLRSAVYGSILTKWGPILISDLQKKEKKHLTSCKHSYKVIEEYVESFGFTMDRLIKDGPVYKAYAERQMFNITFLMDWAQHYEYKGPKTYYRKGLF